MAKQATAPKNIRDRHYRLLQVGKRDLHMADEDYRELLRRHGAKQKDGKYSATTMSVAGLMQAVGEMKQKGFKPQTGGTDWRRPRIEKITALWMALFDAGVVKKPDQGSMVKWCARITRKTRLEWATSYELNACIEGLKDWAHRERVQIIE
jgi:phage gp16-like protein